MIRIILTFLMVIFPLTVHALEISTTSTNLGIGTNSVSNALSIASTLAVGNPSYTSMTAPTGGAIIQGNVGIGTSNPKSLLSLGVGGGASLTGNAFNITSAGNITTCGGVQCNITAATVLLNNQGGAVTFGNSGDGSGDSAVMAVLSPTGYLDFQPSSNTTAMRLTSAGNLGIGTLAPQYTVDTYNGTMQTTDVHFPGGTVGIRAQYAINFDPTGAGTLMTLNYNRNVGIGTLTPAAALDVLGTVRATYFSGNGSALTGIANYSSITQDSNGNIGINTTLPQAKLTLKQTGTTDPFHVASASSVSLFKIVNGGNVGISSSNPGQLLDVQGTVRAINFSGNGSQLTGIPLYSQITQLNNNIGINSTSPGKTLDVGGTVRAQNFLSSGPITGQNNYWASNVGIGSMLPGAALDVQGTARALFFIGNGSLLTGVTATAAAAGGTNAVQYNGGSSTTAGNETVFSDNGSNVGIGTTNGKALLDVEGTVYINGGNVGIGTLKPAGALDVEGTLSQAIFGGNVGIGTLNPQVNLYVKGTETVSGTTNVSGALNLFGTLFNSITGGGQTTLVGTNQPVFSTGITVSGTVWGNTSTTGVLALTSTSVGSLATTDNIKFKVGNNGSLTPMIIQDNSAVSANVGIGTVLPLGMLDVEGTVNPVVFFGTTQNTGTNKNVGIGTVNPGQILDVQGTARISKLGGTLAIASGTNGCQGQGTLSSGTVTISTTCTPATSQGIFLQDATTGSLVNVGTPTVGTVSTGTSFVINSSNALDSSNVNWWILKSS